MVVPTAAKWFFGELIAGAGSVIRAGGHDVLLFELGDPAGREAFFAGQRLRGRADAVLVMSLNLTEAEVLMLRKLELPVVMVGSAVPVFGCVRIDEQAAAMTAVQHLVKLGHEDIGYLGIDDRAEVTAGSAASPAANRATPARWQRPGWIRTAGWCNETGTPWRAAGRPWPACWPGR